MKQIRWDGQPWERLLTVPWKVRRVGGRDCKY